MNRTSLVRILALATLLPACGDDDDDSDGALLSNTSFATGVSGWTAEDPPTATLAWSPLDANGSASSGSVLVTNISVGASNGSGIIQCVTSITPGASYTFGGKVLFPTGQARTGSMQIGLRWRAGAGCTGTVLGSQPRVELSSAGAAWVTLTSSAQVAPVGTVSADFIAFPSKVEAGGTLVGHFDDLFLTKAAANPVLLAPSRP